MPTVTFNLTIAQAQRLAAALGKAHDLKDSAKSPNPRSATAEEVRQFFISRARQLVVDVEGAELQRVAIATATVPAFDPS